MLSLFIGLELQTKAYFSRKIQSISLFVAYLGAQDLSSKLYQRKIHKK